MFSNIRPDQRTAGLTKTPDYLNIKTTFCIVKYYFDLFYENVHHAYFCIYSVEFINHSVGQK